MVIIYCEGYCMFIILGFVLVVFNIVIYLAWLGFLWLVIVVFIIFFVLVLQFFCNLKRMIFKVDDMLVYVFVDGQVVVIEEVEEIEYFNVKCLQVFIFMFLFNVYVNCNFLGGEVWYLKYYLGKYFVVWYFKFFIENEWIIVVIKNG